MRKTRRISDGPGLDEETLRRKRQRRNSDEQSFRKGSRLTEPSMPMEWDITTAVEVKSGKKRSRESTGSVEAANIKKRIKNEPVNPVIEMDDIMSEVEARLKAKAERRKKKKRLSEEEGSLKEIKKQHSRKRRSSGPGREAANESGSGGPKKAKEEPTKKRRSSGIGSGTDDGESRKKRLK